jgi:hypothetical protein
VSTAVSEESRKGGTQEFLDSSLPGFLRNSLHAIAAHLPPGEDLSSLLARACLSLLPDDVLADTSIESTEAALLLLSVLREAPPTPLAARVRALFPELAALAVPPGGEASIEQERRPAGPGPALPLLDHLERVLARKLAGLEGRARGRFQRDEALSPAAFDDEVARLERLRERGLLACVRAALLHLDFAKGGEPAQREAWRARVGADLAVHNVAAREILERATPAGFAAPGLLQRFPSLRAPERAALVLALVESHGLAGQAVRGETPLALFARFVRYLRAGSAA